jgi:adenylate cyclase
MFVRFMDMKIYDTMLSRVHNKAITGVPVIVDLDEKSLAEQGQWPWPRHRVAMLLAKISNLGAASVGLDIVFAERDNTSPVVLKEQLKEELQVDVGFTGLPPALMDNDEVMAGVLSQGPFVLGYYFNFGARIGVPGDNECSLHPVSTAVIKSATAVDMDQFLFSARGVVCNVEPLGSAAKSSGFFNTVPDPDGILRRTPLLIKYQNKYYPSLSLATLMAATGAKQIMIKVTRTGVESVRLGKTIIPVDKIGRLLIHFRGKGNRFEYISATDILNDRLPKDALKGKIVFVGTSAAGLKDLRTTPFDPVYPGVETHATVVDNILKEDFIYRPDWAPGMEWFMVLVFGLLATGFLTFTPALISLIPLVALGAGVWFGAEYYFDTEGIFVSPLFALIALAMNFGLLTLVKFWREEGQKRFLHATFQSYLAPELIDKMFQEKQMPELGGEAREITAYFTDIQSFSTFSEKLTATQVVELLNEYLSAMTDILLEDSGTLDKYEGDAIIAFFGAPMNLPDHALRACRVAVKMQDKLLDLREKWRHEKQDPDEPERNVKGYSPEEWAPGDKWPKIVHDMRMRIGINSGEIVVGNMGSSVRMNYTMMGDPVNLAARLEEGAKQYGVFTMASQYTMDLEFSENGTSKRVADELEARLIDEIAVVGKSEPVRVYELCSLKGGLTDQEKKLFELFQQGLELYRGMQWDEALAKFEEAEKYERYPDAKTTPSRVFIGRCKEYKQSPPVPPGQEWDGVYRMTKK